MAHDVFVSYSQRDKPTAGAVVAGLERRGIRCWMAPRDIVAGSTWGEAIVDAIAGCSAMILVLSSDSNESRQVLREVERAVAIDKVIIPFRIDEVVATGAMSYFLGTEHWLDALTPPLETHIDELAGTVQRLLGAEVTVAAPLPSPPPEPVKVEPVPMRRGVSLTAVALGAAGAVVVAIGLGVGLVGMAGGDGEPSTSTSMGTAAVVTTAPAATTASTVTTFPSGKSTVVTSTAPTITLPDGFEVFDGSRNGFLVGLPDTWLAFDLTTDDFQDLVDAMGDVLSAEELDAIRQVIAGGAEFGLLAFHTSGDPNANVLVMPLGPLDTIDYLEAMLPGQVAGQPGMELVAVDRVVVDGTESLRIVTRADYGGNIAEQHQYYVLGDRLGFVATFTAFSDADVGVFAEIMDTFTVVE